MSQCVDGLRTNTVAMTATGGWTLYKWVGSSPAQNLDEAYVPFFGAFGAAWEDAMVARWSANPLGMLWPEMDAAFETMLGKTEAARQRCGDQCHHRCCGSVERWR